MHLLFAALLLRHWLLASDLHVEPRPGAPYPSYYKQDTNWTLFDSTVAQMRAEDPNPQVVILSGDFLAHSFPHSVPVAEATMSRIARTFNAAFPHAQFVIVPGNNDDPCGDYRATPGSPYFKYLAHLWAPMVNRNGAAPDFEREFGQYGWYRARLPLAHLRVLALDSVYWSIVYRRCANYHPDAPQREMTWLQNSLDALPAAAKAVIVMHIPPGVDPVSTLMTHRLLVVPFIQDQRATAFVRDTGARKDRIAFEIAGHMHRDDFRLFDGVPLLMAPSVSPIYRNNPAFLRLDLASDGTLADYQPFYFDIRSGKWNKERSFDQTYGVQGFTAKNLAAVHDRLGNDAPLRERWSAIFVADSRYRYINGYSWRTYWCAQTQLVGTFAGCAGVKRRTELLPIAAGIAVVLLVGGLALLAVRLGRQRARR